jgi:hypothetical protein
MTKMEMMKYLAIIDYYKLPYSVDDFIHDKNYRKESMKKRVFDEYLKKFDHENMLKHLGCDKFHENTDKMLDLKTLPKVNDIKRTVEEIIKYLKVMRQLQIDYDEDLYMWDKDYREKMMKYVDDNNFLEKYVDYVDLDEEQIKKEIEEQVDIEDCEEEIDDEGQTCGIRR